MNRRLMEKGVALVLKGMGVNTRTADFRRTPWRVAKMYEEMLTPQRNTWAIFPVFASDLIILRGHRVTAICPHHLLPVTLSCNVGYIPNRKALGLSKLARAVEQHLTTPISQEDLAFKVVQELERRLEPKGVGVVLTGLHGCMRFRGVKTDGDVVTSVMKGILLLNQAARSEFLQLIGERRS